MASALKLKNDINKLKAALKSKATPKSFIPKLKSQLEKAEADYESVKAGKKSAPKPSKQVKSSMDKLKQIIKKKKYGAYRAQGVDLKKDADRPALPTGKRISKNGNTYYEYRANRIDVKQPPKRYPKLEDGGMMAGGGKMTANEKWQKKQWEAIEKEEAEKYPYGKRKIKGIKEGDMYYKPSPVTIEKYDSGRDEWAVRDACGGLDRYRTAILTKIIESGDWQEGDYKSKNGKKIGVIREGDMYYKPSPVTIEKYDDGRDEWAVRDACGGLDRYRTVILKQLITEDWEEYASGGYMAGGGNTEGKQYAIEIKLEDGEEMAERRKRRNADTRTERVEVYSTPEKAKEAYIKYKNKGEYEGIKIKRIEYVGVYDEDNFKGGGYMEDGGTIDNSGMTPADLQKQIWNLTARIAKLGDIESRAASDEINMLMKQRKKLQSMALSLGDMTMAQGGELHRSQEEKFKYGGYMAEGGKIKDQYEGREPEDIWNNLSKMQRSHFIFDHASEIEARRGEDKGELKGKEISDAMKMDFDSLDKYIRVTFENHVREGQYKYGGYMAEGGETDDFVKINITKYYDRKKGKWIEINHIVNIPSSIYYDEFAFPSAITSELERNGYKVLGQEWKFEVMAGGGMMAKGGALEHGLKKGDHIMVIRGNMLGIKNEITGDLVTLNIETGERKETKE